MDTKSKLIPIVVAFVVVIAMLAGVRGLVNKDKPRDKDKTSSAAPSPTVGDNSHSSSAAPDRSSPKITAIKPDPNSRTPLIGDREIKLHDRDFSDTRTTPPMNVTTSVLALATPITTATTEQKDVLRQIADLAIMYRNEQDPDERVDIADELGLIDDPEAVRKVLELLKSETHPDVQDALMQAMSGLEALEQMGPEVQEAVKSLLQSNPELEVRISAMDILGEIPTASSVDTLRVIYSGSTVDPAEKLNAADNMLRLHSENSALVSAEEVKTLNDQVKLDFQAGTDTAFRTQAAMALAVSGRDNLPFFQQALASEQDPTVKNLLERLVRMYGTPPQ